MLHEIGQCHDYQQEGAGNPAKAMQVYRSGLQSLQENVRATQGWMPAAASVASGIGLLSPAASACLWLPRAYHRIA